MLRQEFRVLILIIFLVMSTPLLAFADRVQGRVTGVSLNALDLTAFDSQGRPYPNRLHLKIDNSTTYSGVSSADKLRRNDLVEVEVSQEEQRIWRAVSIKKFKETGAVPSTTSQPSPALSSALGNPVVRNALLGAATGALASSASGGKAGKGALIGVGTGVLGGFLADALSGHSQSQSSQTTVTNQQDTRN